MHDLPTILVTSDVSKGDMIGYKLAPTLRMVANVSPVFNASSLKIALKTIEPRAKVVLVGGGISDEDANQAKQVWEQRDEDCQDCLFIRVPMGMLEQEGLDKVINWVHEKVESASAYDNEFDAAKPNAIMLGANRIMGQKLAHGIASRVTTGAFIEKAVYSDDTLNLTLSLMKPVPRVMLVGPAFDDRFDHLETKFKDWCKKRSGGKDSGVFVSVEWSVFREQGGVDGVIQYLLDHLDNRSLEKESPNLFQDAFCQFNMSRTESSTLPRTNPAFVLLGIENTEFQTRDKPSSLGPLDALVAPKKTGLCGSDVHYLKHGAIGDFVVKDPMILGHESSGIVCQVGSNVKHLKPGDRVALEPGESCRVCDVCKAGNYNRCERMVFAATPPYDGTLTGYYKLPADLCYQLPDSVSLEEGALLEPLSVAVMGVSKIGQMPHGANVVVFGAGPVGLLCMAVAKALGARHVLGIDVQQARLDFAKRYAAHDVHLPSKPNDGEDRMAYSRRNAQEIMQKFGYEARGPRGVDLVIDATGAEVCIQTAIFLLKHGGTHVQVGMGPDNVNLPVATLLNKEITMKGSFRYGPGCYQQSLDLVARGLVDLKALVSHRYSFKDARKAFDANRAGQGEDGKPIIKAIIDGPEDE
ncbi:hypothetical protein OIO90_001281 [Microbotryomycetes sp. JL221]|nr:hypothetical protein OIO90_001281 [Microbotryomycetes sp. JL221]